MCSSIIKHCLVAKILLVSLPPDKSKHNPHSNLNIKCLHVQAQGHWYGLLYSTAAEICCQLCQQPVWLIHVLAATLHLQEKICIFDILLSSHLNLL